MARHASVRGPAGGGRVPWLRRRVLVERLGYERFALGEAASPKCGRETRKEARRGTSRLGEGLRQRLACCGTHVLIFSKSPQLQE